MPTTTREVSLADVLSGTLLAVSVNDSHGQLLLPAGSVLTESALAGLRRRAVESLWIREDSVLSADQRAARQAAIERRLQRVFRNAGDNAAMNELRRRVADYRIGQE